MAAEKQFETKIKKFLDEKGCYYIKHFANAYTKSGIPDILACVNGHFVGIEVKAPNGKPSELQLYNIKEINETSGFGVVLYPNQFEDFKMLVDCLINHDTYYARATTLKINERR
jgi:Holliday junction resolvase